MHFRPLHDRVLVRRIDAEEKTAGGIIIPDTAKEKPQEGERAGPGCLDSAPLDLSGFLPGYAERGALRFCRCVGRA
ncbi:hypothetical protein BRDID11004_31440 [Bradyrhizobium diazoefficiens]|uniref:10 kDa chaperonin n=1 Tax=Bradyrhizobium diazoefficiens TaxID=1355477 RepID=A0A810ASH5_9BRAD|nr:hypothetical protein F07S3_57830 [Bradyrhizobium diazoefficiens]BCA13634.1 hypothetical protein BDHF08_54810 [Bradyrhizobium diazoefficiens]BCE58044.1 hypothetical protein XF5B_55560 [Bradyrhizobium diazoefficiens]BCE66721.1 hypothetical protein XF6B_55200 [Bradyrhizobium diazoefficiens]